MWCEVWDEGRVWYEVWDEERVWCLGIDDR